MAAGSARRRRYAHEEKGRENAQQRRVARRCALQASAMLQAAFALPQTHPINARLRNAVRASDGRRMRRSVRRCRFSALMLRAAAGRGTATSVSDSSDVHLPMMPRAAAATRPQLMRCALLRTRRARRAHMMLRCARVAAQRASGNKLVVPANTPQRGAASDEGNKPQCACR